MKGLKVVSLILFIIICSIACLYIIIQVRQGEFPRGLGILLLFLIFLGISILSNKYGPQQRNKNENISPKIEREAIENVVNINQAEVSKNINIGTLGSPEQGQLTTPCKVIFYRDSSFLGALAPQIVNLNGKKISKVNNGKSIEFTTNKKSNIIIVTDHKGGASTPYQFDTVDGSTIEVHFKLGKFN
jgi:hypothetical protein